MLPQEIIRTKRDGGELTAEEISFLVLAYTKEEVPDYQVAAWLMADTRYRASAAIAGPAARSNIAAPVFIVMPSSRIDPASSRSGPIGQSPQGELHLKVAPLAHTRSFPRWRSIPFGK